MIYLRLFTAFIKIGFTSFGGMSMSGYYAGDEGQSVDDGGGSD